MIGILAAPTNLGLRPPERGGEPGCSGAPEALRAAGLHARLLATGRAEDVGVVEPGPYVAEVGGPGRSRNQDAVVDHARRLADEVRELWATGRTPLVLGGDCSVLVGIGLALARRDDDAGLVHLDGHTDLRHPGNDPGCVDLAGEDLAAVVGLHRPVVSDLDGLSPYVRPERAVHVGCRDDDAWLDEARRVLGNAVTAAEARALGADRVVRGVREVVAGGHWLHLDVDVLDPAYMPAVDSPDPGGLDPGELAAVLHRLAPDALGASVTIFDPDLDPDGRHAALLARLLGEALAGLGRDGADPV